MLVTGCANPAGESADAGYNGLYFTDTELQAVVGERRMIGLPVKAEHGGAALGYVVSSYLDGDGRLNCVMRIDEDSVEGAVAAGLVRDGIATELSLGYAVDVAHSQDGERLQAQTKELHEVSLVCKGARHACLITGYQDDGGATFARVRAAGAAGAAGAGAQAAGAGAGAGVGAGAAGVDAADAPDAWGFFAQECAGAEA
jgi:hypothetical protein